MSQLSQFSKLTQLTNFEFAAKIQNESIELIPVSVHARVASSINFNTFIAVARLF